MTRLFEPAIALMDRLKYPQKLALISLLLVLPLTLTIVLLTSDVSAREDFTHRELAGISYLRPLRQTYEHTLQNKWLAQQYLSRNQPNRAALLDNLSRLEASF